jgi:anti-sigma B factor antagonist
VRAAGNIENLVTMQHPSDSDPTRIDSLGIRPPAAFEIQASALGEGVSLLLLRGELDLASAAGLRSRVEAAAASGLIIDLREVTFIDSSALRELLNAREELARHGSRLVLSGVPASVRRLLDMTGTADLFETAETRAEAIRRFG